MFDCSLIFMWTKKQNGLSSELWGSWLQALKGDEIKSVYDEIVIFSCSQKYIFIFVLMLNILKFYLTFLSWRHSFLCTEE